MTGLLCEQLIMLGYCVCVIDPEGDYTSVEALPGVMVLGGEDPLPTPRDLIRTLRYPDRSVVIDLSRRPHDEKIQHIRALLPALNVLRQRTGLPHRIVLDEAHYYLHGADAPQLLDLERDGYTVVTREGSSLDTPAAALRWGAASTTLIFALFGAVRGLYADQLARLATTDPLTGLFNAGAFHERLRQELERRRTEARAYSLG